MVIIHDLIDETVKVVIGPDSVRSKTDKIGVATAMQMKDVITMGKTIYEFSPQLERFANTWGRRWKSILRDAWNTGGYPHSTPREDVAVLQRLRNTTLGGSL